MAPDHSDTLHNIRRVQIALALTASFMVVEVIGGLMSGSLALLADAGHMLADTLALSLALIAFRVSERPADAVRSYGYARFQILAAFVNGLALLVIVVWIGIEAVQRLMAPSDVMGPMMFIVATAGLLINLASFVILHGGNQNNLNIRAAAIHVLGDLLGSGAAVAAAIVIMLTGWMPIDPILSLLVAGLICKSAWQLVRRSGHILLEGVPEGMQVTSIRERLIQVVPEVRAIHHVHVWGLTPQQLMLTMHVVLLENAGDASPIVRRVKSILKSEFSINHSTIEVEVECCADD